MRSAVDYVIDTLLAITLLVIVFIGVLLAWFIPKGAEAPGYEKYLWGLHRHEWGELHLWVALAFLALVIIHLALHWRWLKTCARQRLPRSIIVWFLVVAVGAALIVAIGMTLYPKGRYQDEGQQRQRRGAASRESF